VTGVDGIDGKTAKVASYRCGGIDMKDIKQRPETKTTLRLPRELWDRVRHRAIDEGLSAQAMVERMIETYLTAQKSRTERSR
jgi:Ribbon-helix-helix protein, copG family